MTVKKKKSPLEGIEGGSMARDVPGRPHGNLGLVGKRITAIQIDRERDFLQFHTDQGTVVWGAYGDCCSESWFQDLINVHALIDYDDKKKASPVVTAVEEVAMGEVLPATRQDYDQLYCVNIKTARGVCSVVFRNSSNGYYGGDVQLVDTSHWASGKAQTVEWVTVAGDVG